MKTSYAVLFAFIHLVETFTFAACPAITFNWEGGLSPYGKVHIEVRSSGSVLVSLTRRQPASIDYKTTLNEFEQEYLNGLVRDSELANSATEGTQPPPTDVGRTTFTVETGSSVQRLTYRGRSQVSALEDFFWRIAAQADLDKVPEGNERMYDLYVALDPSSVGPKVLQPYLFRQPLAESLKNQTDFQQLAWRLNALSCITTPIEFAGLVAQHLDHRALRKWRLWLTTLSTPECYGSLQRDHFVALFPLFENQIRKYGDEAKTTETPEGEAFRRFRNIMKK